jgi:signal transduction histidine kinase
MPARFLQAVSKAKSILESRREDVEVTKDEFLFVRDSNITRRLRLDDIFYAEAMGDYVKFYTREKMFAIHEIRTPLSGILGFTNLLQKRSLDETSKEFVSSIQRSGENLMAIINDILDLSKIEAGMMRITKGIFSINGLVNSVETFFIERAKEKGLTISSKIDPSIPDTLNGDATRLTQILVNLIGNAIKFTHQGNINIEIYNKQQTENEIIVGPFFLPFSHALLNCPKTLTREPKCKSA